MIGIIIQAQCDDNTFKNKIFARLGDMCSLEMVMKSCLGSAHAQRVTVSMPASDRAAIHGSLARQGLINKNLSVADRRAGFVFHFAKHPLERLYYAARDQGLSTIVRVQADGPFLPTWLINEMICKYKKDNVSYLMHSHKFGPGLLVEIMPFWMLADAHIHLDNKDEFYKYISKKFESFGFLNKDESYIPTPFSLHLKSTDQLVMFQRIADEVQAGRDLGDLLGEIANDQI